jgi:hypothetical protein
MSQFSFGTRPQDPHADAAEAPEDPVVRQNRYLLRTAPADALEAAHSEALSLLPEAHQESLLATLRGSLLVGDHLAITDHAKIAHLVTSGERRSPRQLMTALPTDVLHDLAAAVLESESSYCLLRGYAYWDGAEPQATDDSLWAEGGFDPKRGRWDARNDAKDGRQTFGPGHTGG